MSNRLTVFHVLPFKLAFSNGVQSAAWNLAVAQAKLGLDVVILSLGRKPSNIEVEALADTNVHLDGLAKSELLSYSITRRFLDKWLSFGSSRIVHFHSVFIPQQTLLACCLRRRKIPYCVTFAGNFLAMELRRKSVKKALYRFLLEDSFARHASLLIAVSVQETTVIKGLFPTSRVEYLPNALLPPPAAPKSLNRINIRHASPPSGCFLGKKDLYHKGLDRLISTSSSIESSIDAYLIESNQAANNKEFENYLSRHNSPYFSVLGAVYGEQKFQVLSCYDYYIHLARWEVFGVAILEAMSVGLPVILSRECDLSHFVEEEHLGLVVDYNKADAMTQIRAYLGDRGRMRGDGSRAASWARQFTEPHRLALTSRTFYQSMLDQA
jgi:glycosyltransferase involved in cell wall biosynthesis